MIHELKCLPKFFEPLSRRDKTFEIRKNDRRFTVGDHLLIREWCPNRQTYTGRELTRFITYITDFPDGIREGYVVMGLL